MNFILCDLGNYTNFSDPQFAYLGNGDDSPSGLKGVVPAIQ